MVEEQRDEVTETKTYNYVYDNEDIILEYLTKSDGKIETTRYVHGLGIDEPLSIDREGEVYYYHADGLGSITMLTDEKGRVVQEYEYDSFGNMKHQGNKVKQSYTFTAREWDEEIELYYYRARYYDAEVGRFTSFDPILHPANDTTKCRQLKNISITSFESLLENPQSLNPFVYTENNPINKIDPLGLLRFTSVGPGGCSYYKNLCDRTVGEDKYACDVYDCCQDFGDGCKENCIRGCLIEFDKRHCAYLTGEARNRCRRIAHLDCYDRCLAYHLALRIPASCYDAMDDIEGYWPW